MHHHDSRHDHHHRHQVDDTNLKRLGLALILVLIYMVAEVIGGLLTRSLALLADAGHMFSDAASLGLALFALWLARRPTTPERTYGYHRTEILAALINGTTLVAISILIVVEAWQRFQQPVEVEGQLMMWIAVGGLVINLIGVWILHGGKDASLNVRGAWLHMMADTLGSAQAIIAGALIWAFGWHWADPAASVLIAILVVLSSWSLLKESVHVLMEGTPNHIDADEVKSAIREVAGVDDVHDLHVWTITSGFEALSVHACCAEGQDRDRILAEVRSLVRDRFQIDHSTIQLEGLGVCDGDERCG